MPAKCCLEKVNTLPKDEPIFSLFGRDLLAAATIKQWLYLAKAANVPADKVKRVEDHLEAIEKFQSKYPERCKIPD